METSDEKPWNEEQWARFMQRSDARSARFGELLETLIDHPDREAIIAREMGWDFDEEELSALSDVEDEALAEDWQAADRESAEAPVNESDAIEAADADIDLPFDEDDDDDQLFALEDDEDEFPSTSDRSAEKRKLPVYCLAYDVGLEVHRALRPYMEKLDVDNLDEPGERMQSAYGNSLIPAAKIAGGHGMGYDDEVLCGHIVYLRIGLDACVTAREDITWLEQHNHLPTNLAKQLGGRLDEVRHALEERIVELRSRVWWD